MKAKALPIFLSLLMATVGYFVGKGGKSTAVSSDQAASDSSTSSLIRSAASESRSSSTRAATSKSSDANGSAGNKKWTTGNPIDRLDMLAEITDPMESARSWMEFVDSLSAEQYADVVKEFRERGMNSTNMSEYAMLLSGWAKVAPLEALDFATKNTQNPFARQTILATWSQKDPAAAVQWARDNHKGEGANPWMVGVIRGLAFQDTAQAEKLLKEMPRSQQRGEGLDALMPALLKQGTESARSWVTSITDESLREGAMTRMSEATMQKDPEGTANWLVANPSEATRRNLDDSVYAMAEKDPSAAMKFFQDMPAGENRSNALRGLVNATASNSPKEASALMDRHSADVNDRMVQQFVWHSFQKDPQVAVSNIGRLGNEEERNRMYSRSIEWWMNRDQKAAFQWMSNNQLPQSVVDRLNRAYQGMQTGKQ
jgi:hypothetical protein